MSAQRSRQRQKDEMKQLEQHNNFLQEENSKLWDLINALQKENNLLTHNFKNGQNDLEKEDNDDSRISSYITREERSKKSSGKLKSALFLATLLTICVLNGTNKENSNIVKIGGVIPFFGKNLKQSPKSLSYFEEKCKNFCDKNDHRSWLRNRISKKVEFIHDTELVKYNENGMENDLVPMVCINPHEINSELINQVFLLHRDQLKATKLKTQTYYIPEILEVRSKSEDFDDLEYLREDSE